MLDRQDENGASPNSCVKHFLKRSMFHYHVRLLQGIMNSMHYLHLWSLGTLRHCRNSSFLMVRSKTSYTLVVILLNSRLLRIFTMYPPQKLTMTMKNPPFEDVLSKMVIFKQSMLVFRGVCTHTFHSLHTSLKGSLVICRCSRIPTKSLSRTRFASRPETQNRCCRLFHVNATVDG